MRIGVPKEIKNHEYRVAMTPAGVKELTSRGHSVFIETTAGVGSGHSDDDYTAVGATIVDDAKTVFDKAHIIVKVKEPQPSEIKLFKSEHVLFTYLHLAADAKLTKALVETGATCIAYETITDDKGLLPLLAPMSEIAGKIAVQAGARLLEKANGGSGKLLGGATGVPGANVLIIGGGIAGENAAKVACGMGASVTVLDRNLDRLRYLDAVFAGRISTQYSTTLAIEDALPTTDLVIGSVLLKGAKAPRVITKDNLSLMKAGSVLVDISIDQGGCFETSKPTTHQSPSYVVDDIVHYCVANIPGAVPQTSTAALTNATLPYLLRLIDLISDSKYDVQRGSLHPDLRFHKDLLSGVNIYRKELVEKHVAESTGIRYASAFDRLQERA